MAEPAWWMFGALPSYSGGAGAAFLAVPRQAPALEGGVGIETEDRALPESHAGWQLRKIGSRLHRSAILAHLRTPLYTNAYYLIANTMVLSLSGFLFWTVAARLYDPGQVGVGSALIAASILLATISALGLGTGLIRFLPTAEDPWPMIATSVALPAMASVLSGAVFLLGARFWSPELAFVSQQPLLFASFAVFTAGGALSGLLDNLFVAQRRAKYTFLKGVIVGFGRIPLLIGLSFIAGAFAIFGAGGLVTIVVVVAALWRIWLGAPRAGSPRRWFGTQVLGDMIGFSLGNYVADLIYRAPAMLLPLVVLNVLGPEANGYFYISWMLGGLLSIIPAALAQSLFAEGSRFESHLEGDATRAVKLSLALVLPAVVAAFLLADKLLLLFGRAYAAGGASLLRILILAALPVVLNSIYFTVKRVEKKISAIIALSALLAAGTLGLSHLLLPRLGLSGVGIAWLASQAIVAAMVALSPGERQWT